MAAAMANQLWLPNRRRGVELLPGRNVAPVCDHFLNRGILLPFRRVPVVARFDVCLSQVASKRVPLRRLDPTSPVTTARMKSIRQCDTAPELAVRSLLHGLGVRFRTNPSDLPGRPDIANRSRRWCIFVHGCFWHGHISCHLARLPRSNPEWWQQKIRANQERDARKEAELRAHGFRVGVVWQCELRDQDELVKHLLAITRGLA